MVRITHVSLLEKQPPHFAVVISWVAPFSMFISSPAFLVYSSAMFFVYSAISPHRARFYSQSYLEPFKAAEYIYTVWNGSRAV